jgi:alcohol oxidase
MVLRAVGVKTVPTKPLSPGQDHAKVYRARKQIVSFYTPESLLRLHRGLIQDND